ncbi:MAG TPA: hypothetical protein VFD43_10390 [Planctomycetota bacterium]|nr:hypothetical protein [Planctomycetota bacterium]
MAAAGRATARLPGGALLLAVCAAVLPAGCSHVSAYGRSRGLDALDTIPMSIGWGWGISGSVQGTPCLRLGLGVSPVVSERFGYEDRRLWGKWDEYESAFPWVIWLTGTSDVPPRPPGANAGRAFGDGPPLMYRWQIDRDAPLGEGEHAAGWEPLVRQWGRHAPYGRETGGGLIVPAFRRRLVWQDLHLQQGDNEGLHRMAAPDLATLWAASRDGPDEPQAWDLFQVDLFAGILGLRLGFRPLEGVDFVLGIVGIDLAADDVYAPRSSLPQGDAEATGE